MLREKKKKNRRLERATGSEGASAADDLEILIAVMVLSQLKSLVSICHSYALGFQMWCHQKG